MPGSRGDKTCNAYSLNFVTVFAKSGSDQRTLFWR